MERKDLTGIRFKSTNGKDYVILSGYQKGEIIYEECGNPNAPLNFCCDAQIINNHLKGSYCVNYTITKEEFFAVIDILDDKNKGYINTITSALRERFYKIPTVFLKLIVQAYLKERECN